MDRRFPIVDFDAQKFLGFFGKKTESLQVELLSGGACNSNYLVQSSDQKFVCRIYNRGNPSLERSILEQVNGIIPSPKYLWVDDGVSVMTYIEGRHFEPTPNLVQEAGRMIANLSRVKFSRSGQLLSNGEILDHEGWNSYEEGLLAFLDRGIVRDFLGEGMISELRVLLTKHRGLLESFDDCQNLVHGDFRPDNILVANDSITGVLDWEFAHSGCSYTDIGNLLRHIPVEWRKDFRVGLCDEGFELPDDWAFRASLIDLTSHLEFLTSNRSNEFKNTCVERIHRLIKFKDTNYA